MIVYVTNGFFGNTMRVSKAINSSFARLYRVGIFTIRYSLLKLSTSLNNTSNLSKVQGLRKSIQTAHRTCACVLVLRVVINFLGKRFHPNKTITDNRT